MLFSAVKGIFLWNMRKEEGKKEIICWFLSCLSTPTSVVKNETDPLIVAYKDFWTTLPTLAIYIVHAT